MKLSKMTTFVAGLLFSVAALALELDDAKNMGLVGEQPNGYLGLISANSPEAAALVVDINAKRQGKGMSACAL